MEDLLTISHRRDQGQKPRLWNPLSGAQPCITHGILTLRPHSGEERGLMTVVTMCSMLTLCQALLVISLNPHSARGDRTALILDVPVQRKHRDLRTVASSQ